MSETRLGPLRIVASESVPKGEVWLVSEPTYKTWRTPDNAVPWRIEEHRRVLAKIVGLATD